MGKERSPLRVAVLASGTGSNLAALIANVRQGTLSAEIVLVVSNNADAGALRIARENAIPALHLSRKHFDSQEALDSAFLAAFREHRVDLIVLAGYMKMLSPAIVRAYKHRILNIHPALLPAFGGKGMYGRHVHQAVLDYGCKVTGVTVHLVDEGYDTGPPVLQRAVPVEEGDTPESLAARVLAEEHKLYSEAVQLFAERRVEVHDRKVVIKPK